jgi:hypothetical protein
MTAKHTKAVEVFYSYAHEDERFRKTLEKHLSILQKHGLIAEWHDREIMAGKEWALEIDAHLSTAQIILLLVSPDFIASDYCYGVELKRAMERHNAGEAHVIPIILRPVYFEDEPFSKLQVLPVGGKPVKSWSNSDEAFVAIAKGIGKVARELLIEQLLTVAEQLYKDKRLEQALVACEQAIHLGFNSASVYWRKGNILLNCKRYGEAFAAYQEAIRLDPNIADPYFYQNKGHALRNLKRYEEALAAYEQAIRLSMPDPDPRLYYDKGVVLERLAEQAYDTAKKYSQGASHGTLPN